MKTRDLLFLTTACGLAIAAAPSWAQSSGDAAVQAAETAEEEAPAELVITGSRIDRAGFDAPTPTTVLSGDALLQGDRPSIAQVLNDLPQFRASTTPVTNFSGTASGSSPADLRGLGSTRTLTLLNGRRFTGAGDLNTVPQGLISRVEVVTGGASAAWGSGAVGGVVNILLNEQLEGLTIGAQSGVSSREDAFRYGFDATFGTKFADGAGHFMIGVQYMNDEGVLDRDSRPNLGSTTLFSKPGGGRVIAQDVNYSNASVGGLITTGILAGQTFERDGTLRPFRFGTPNDGSSMVGGEGTSLRDETALSAPYQRLNGYARASYEIGDAKLWVDGSYSRMWAEYPFYAESNRGSSVITVSRDNPFLPKAVRDRLIAANQTSFRMGRVFEDYGYRTFGYTRETIDAAIGIDGSFGGGKWRYSAYYGHGQLIDDRGYLNQKVDANFTRAIDVVAHPVTGAPICRVALTDPSTACRPLNVFGEGNADPAAVAYAFSNKAHVRNTTKLDTAAVSLRGDPFSLWAGPVSIAIGAEARWESIESSGLDPISAARGFTTFNFSELNGGFNVKEGFAEVAVPLLDQDFSKLEFSAAGRYSHYSNTGSVNSWKLGLTNRVYSELLLRVSRSRDIRSGSLSELFTNRSTTRSTVADGSNGSYEIITYGGGNQALDPEIGETTTVGASWSPSFIPGLSLSVDYFDIRIKGAISTLSGQDIITRCANGNTALCGQIVRNASDNKIAHIFATFVNLAEYKTHGIDFEASYNLPLSKLSASWPGTLKFRGLATYVPSLTTDDGVSKIEYAGEVGEALPFGTPKWRASGSLTYQDQSLSVDARLRYVAGGMWNSALKDLENNRISARTYVDLGARVTIDKLTLSLNVNNLFDVDPPLTTTGQIHYDQIGRYFSTTAKIRF